MKRETLFAVGLSAALISTAVVGSNHNTEGLSKHREVVASYDRISQSTARVGSLIIKSELDIEGQIVKAKLPVKRGPHPFSNLSILEPEVVRPAITKGTIYILGDSLTEGMQLLPNSETLEDHLKVNGWTSMISAHCGRPLMGDQTYESCDSGRPTELTAVSQIRQPEDHNFIAHAEVIGIELGTNDFYRPTDLFTLKARALVNDIQKINPNAEIYWLNTFLKGKGDGYKGVNQGIAKSGAKVIDFASQAKQFYPDNIEIHPVEDGYHKMVENVIVAVGKPKG